MNKIYNFLSLMLFFMAGALSAFAADDGRDWTIWEVSKNQIEAPEDGMMVVLQQGNNSTWSRNGYLNPSGSFLSTIDATCVYELVDIGMRTEDGYDVYVLQNVSNKQYLCNTNSINNNYYTYSLREAFKCTILKADASGKNIRSYSINGGSWVLCDKDLLSDGSGSTYLGYAGCPSFYHYTDTNDWHIYEATSHALSTDEKLETIYNELFNNGFPGVEYVVGTELGCISQELYNKLETAYIKAKNALGNPEVSDVKKESIVSDLCAAQDELNNDGRIMPKPGKYYMFINQRTQDAMYDDGASLRCTKNKADLNNPPTADDTKHIWSVVDAGNGKYYIQNYYTGRYAGSQSSTSSQFPTTENPTTKCIVTFNPNGYVPGLMFNITDNDGNMWHNDAYYQVVKWQGLSVNGSYFAIKEVPTETIESLKAAAEKALLMGKYNDLIKVAKSTATKYLYDSDVTFDDQYAAKGLVNSFEAANATDPDIGKESYAFDGNVNTFYHTLRSGNKEGEYHWVQVNLGEEPIQKLFVKFTQHHNNRKGNPSRIALVAPAATDDFEGAWTDTLYKDTVIYQYATTFLTTGTIPNTTAIIRVDLGKPVTHLRFVGLQTKANSLHGLGPCWHVSELRFYKDGGENLRYALIPEETKQDLADAITHAEELASDSSATQADYETLDNTIKKFNAAYEAILHGVITNMTKSSYATLYSDKPLVVPEGVEAAIVVGDDNGIHNDYRYKPGMVIPAYTGVLLKGEMGKVYKLDIGATTQESPSDNLLHGTLTNEATNIAGNNLYYKLSYDAATGKELGFYWGSKNGAPFINKAGKAFLAIPVSASQSLMGISLFDLDNGLATGITETTTSNGELKVYDLNGRRIEAKSVKDLQPGIYVVNGKKMYVK